MNISKLIKIINFQIHNNHAMGYIFGYPNKRAHRPMPGLKLDELWNEQPEALNLYVHVPFCRSKCAYCNLFSIAVNSEKSKKYLDSFVDTVIKEIDYYKRYFQKTKIVSLSYGGGTPNFLPLDQLRKIHEKLMKSFPVIDSNIEISMECSPEILDGEYIAGLKALGIDRISIGVQTFDKRELDIIKRKYVMGYNAFDIYDMLRENDINVNIDLIFGLPDQTEEVFLSDLNSAIDLGPESICVHPLAVSKLTALNRMNKDFYNMPLMYKISDLADRMLEGSGYKNQFVIRYVKSDSSTDQQQRMEFVGVPSIGFGAGARSISPEVQYSLPWKIRRNKIMPVIDTYLEGDFEHDKYEGFVFDEDERKRKYVILHLLDPGLNKNSYRELFDEPVESIFSNELLALGECSMLEDDSECMYLTKKGRTYADIVVNVLQSENVAGLYKSFIEE